MSDDQKNDRPAVLPKKARSRKAKAAKLAEEKKVPPPETATPPALAPEVRQAPADSTAQPVVTVEPVPPAPAEVAVKIPQREPSLSRQDVMKLLFEFQRGIERRNQPRGVGKAELPKGHVRPQGAAVQLPAAPVPAAHKAAPQVEVTVTGSPIRRSTFPQNVRTYATPVHANYKELAAQMVKYGATVRPSQELRDGGSNPHAVSAAVRAAATAEAFARLYEMGHRRCLSLWGSGRDEVICGHGNSGLLPVDKFHLTVHRPVFVPQDINRVVRGSMPIYNVYDHDSFLMVDVYETPSGPLSPEFVAQHLQSGAETFVWIGHDFNGQGGTIHGEGAWLRKGDKIKSYPDRVSGAYPEHDPCEWIFTQSSAVLAHDNLVWSTYRAFGSMRIVVFKRGHCVAGISQARAAPEFEIVEIPQVDWSSVLGTSPFTAPLAHALSFTEIVPFVGDIVRGTLPCKKVLVHSRTFRQLCDQFGARERNLILYKQLRVQIARQFADNPEIELLRARFGNELRDITEHTTTAAFVHGIAEFRVAVSSIRSAYGEQIADIKVDGDNLGIPRDRRISRWVYGVLACVTVYVIRRYGFIGTLRLVRSLLARLFVSTRNPIAPASIVSEINDKKEMVVEEVKIISKVIANNISVSLTSIVSPIIAFNDMRVEYRQAFVSIMTAPIVEEILKRAWRPLAYAIPVFEVFKRTLDGMPLDTSIPPFMMHMAVNRMPLKWAILIHGLWNLLAFQSVLRMQPGCTKMSVFVGLVVYAIYLWMKQFEPETRFSAFKRLNYSSPWEERCVDKFTRKITSFSPKEAFVDYAEEPHFNPKPLCSVLRLKGELVVSPRSVKHKVCWMLPTSVPAYAPAATDANMLGVLSARILVAPPLDPIIQREAWAQLPLLRVPSYPDIDWSDHVNDWIEHFDDAGKRKKYRALLPIYRANGKGIVDHEARHVDLFVKTNEVLMKFDDEGVYCKPRPIANVSPYVQLEVGPVLYEAAKRMKETFSVRPEAIPFFEGRVLYELYISYAGAFTDADLSEWMENVYENLAERRVFIIVSGDDSLVIFQKNGIVYIMEGDASMYDQSESFGPLLHEYCFLRALGTPLEVCTRLFEVARAPYHARARDKMSRLVVDRTNRPFRDTGGPDTSIGNSYVMARACVYVVTHPTFSTATAQTLFSSLGLDMKIKFLDTHTQATFLKGMWYRTVNCPLEFWWAPLPSRILKIGKSLRDPRSIYRTKDLPAAATQYLGDVAECYAHFAQVPILKSFVSNFRLSTPRRLVKLEKHKVAAAGNAPCLDELDALEQICIRYSLDKCEVEYVERMFPRVPFTFLEDPVYARIAEVDYC